MDKPYIQNEGKIVNTNSVFTHVMAIALDPRTNYRDGVIRCVKSRSGDIAEYGYIDRSELHRIVGNSNSTFLIGDKLRIINEEKMIESIRGKLDFIGLEDPDIWIDEKTDLMHLYFTLPLIDKTNPKNTRIHLGHAVCKNLDSLEMTEPILLADDIGGAKELSIAPVNSKGVRLNLIESSKKEEDFTYSVVRIAQANEMGKPWKFGDIVFHPKEKNIAWIGGHASPGPMFSKSFIDIGPNKVVGIMNGREANRKEDGKIKYGIFSIGLFIYDYEKGTIDWVSPEPFIRDSEAKTITFASQFVESDNGIGTLYAHVDDSFIRTYTLNAKSIRLLLPK